MALIAAHFLVDGPERLVFGEQATTATPVIFGLMLAAGLLYAADGWVAAGRLTPTATAAGVGGSAPDS